MAAFRAPNLETAQCIFDKSTAPVGRRFWPKNNCLTTLTNRTYATSTHLCLCKVQHYSLIKYLAGSFHDDFKFALTDLGTAVRGDIGKCATYGVLSNLPSISTYFEVCFRNISHGQLTIFNLPRLI